MYKVTKMTNQDIPRVEAFLNARKDTTLFALGNIQQCGLENEYICYGWSDGDGQIIACVFNFSQKYATPVLHENMPVALCAEIREFITQMKHEDVAAFDLYFDKLQLKANYPHITDISIAKTDPTFMLDCQDIPDVSFHVLTSEGEDFEQLAVGLTQVEEFFRHDVEANKEGYRRSLSNEWTLYAKLKGEIVGAASVSGISETTAVVTNVWVLPQARKRGIARQLTHRVQKEFLTGDRTMYIMYSNPSSAGKIYLSNGFVQCGKGYIAAK